MTEPPDSPSLDLVTAALRADSSDIAIYARVLTESIGDALPPDCVTVERDRSVSDRMKGRPGTVRRITVRLGEQVMTLQLIRGAPAAEICREVRGVVLSRQPVGVGDWAAALASALVSYADQNAATAEALRKLVAGGWAERGLSGWPRPARNVGCRAMSALQGAGRLGPYQLQEQLGEGGMGVVYRANGPDGRPVAVKVLRQGVPAEAIARHRLAREVATMRRVHSPFVAEVVDADVESTPPYIVTRYVAGQTLDQVIAANGPLTGAGLGGLARGLAAALVAVHAAGVVHRDLKPANVMLVNGEPVVIDFGIAQAADSTRLTMTGMFMGTPGFLAPEVIEGKPGGPASDVHSFAATLAFAATGRPPFGTGQFEAIFYRIVHGQPDLDRMPAALLPIVTAALARDPSRRPSASELVAMVASLPAEALVPAASGTLAASTQTRRPAAPLRGLAAPLPGPVTSTSLDLPPHAGQPVPVAQPALAWPGTMPIGARRPDDFADLLPPVQYQRPAQSQQAATSPPAAAGQLPAGQPAAGLAVIARPAPSPGVSRLLVGATLASLVAVSVLLPVIGAAVALALIVLLRAADHTAGWLRRRQSRQGQRRADTAAAAAFYPWAICRSVLAVILLAPFAVLAAAIVALVTVLADGPAQLSRAGAFAVGAFIACYCIGPGSRACRRPLRSGYDRLSRTGPTAIIGSLGVAAMALGIVAAAATMNPGYWPAVHLGNQLQSASFAHPGFSHLPRTMTGVGRQLARWLGL